MASENIQPPTPANPPLAAPAEPIQDYLAFAILTTLFCCLPFGIIAIVYAAKVGPLKSAGDLAGALAMSKKAKRWTWWAFGLGLAVIVLTGLFSVAAALLGITAG